MLGNYWFALEKARKDKDIWGQIIDTFRLLLLEDQPSSRPRPLYSGNQRVAQISS